MNIDKRCGNCGKYPLCEFTLGGANSCCNEWIERKINIDMEVTNEYFKKNRKKSIKKAI